MAFNSKWFFENLNTKEFFNMPEGIVKWFNKKKNFGFIASKDQEDVFFHGSQIIDHGFFGLTSNDKVSFEIKDTQNGRQAVKVKVTS